MRPDLRPADQPFERVAGRHWHQWHIVGRLPPALELVGDCRAHRLNGPALLRCDLPLTSTGTGRGGKSGSGGDTATDNEIMAPAAMITQPDASSCFACIAGTVCAIRGIGMTRGIDPDKRQDGTAIPMGASPSMSALPRH